MQDLLEKGVAGVSAIGSAAWIGAPFGYGVTEIGGEVGGVMLATVLALVGAAQLAQMSGLAE